VLLSRPQPEDVGPYKSCLGPRVRFDQVYSAVRFARRWLTQPTLDPDPKRYKALLQAVEAHAAVQLVPRLHRALRVLLIQGQCSGDSLAQMLSLGRRTLNRRLRAQGTTFQMLLDEVRFDVARQLLAHTHTPLDQIASALCYADVSGFMHAFRRWTGTTPAQYRHQLSRLAGAGKRPSPR
jgi:AraC-like DNA-binding protein